MSASQHRAPARRVRTPRRSRIGWGVFGAPAQVGPCGDPLGLWFCEFDSVMGTQSLRVRRYFATKREADQYRRRLGA